MATFRLFDTTIKVKAVVLFDILALWGLIVWLSLAWHPGRSVWQAVLIGLASVLLMLPADFGHAVAHIFSARFAGAPMDEILISEGMPRTLYWHNDVSPNTHRLRALGGPIFNVFGLSLSLVVYAAASSASLVRELAAWSAFGHALILVLSLMPLPIVDGGTLLKWTLVARGQDPARADAVIRRIDWVVGIIAGIVGLFLVATKIWLAGLIVLAAAAAVMAVAAGKIH
jgi:hypothetical protein